MKRIYFFRHGEPDGSGFLTEKANEAIGELGRMFRANGSFPAGRTRFICSSELRTFKTLQRMMSEAGVNTTMDSRAECNKSLFSNNSQCDVDKAVLTVLDESEDYEVLVVVTHYEMMQKLPQAIARTVLGSGAFPEGKYHYGEGCVLDIEQGTLKDVVLEIVPH